MRRTYRTGPIEVPALRGVSLRSLPGNSRLLRVRLVRAKLPCSTSSADSIGRTLARYGWQGRTFNSCLQVSWRIYVCSASALSFRHTTCCLSLPLWKTRSLPCSSRAMPARQRREKVEKLFSEIGLAGLEDRRPAELSGGQQQRVAVARAMVTEPALILADEPTANLDSASAIALLDVMEQLNRTTGTTFLFSTHDPQVMERAHRLIRLRDGQITGDETRSGQVAAVARLAG